jgi:hypothetical protein
VLFQHGFRQADTPHIDDLGALGTWKRGRSREGGQRTGMRLIVICERFVRICAENPHLPTEYDGGGGEWVRWNLKDIVVLWTYRSLILLYLRSRGSMIYGSSTSVAYVPAP